MDLNNLMERLGSGVRRLLRTLPTLAVVLVILIVGESLPPLRDFETSLQEEESLRRVLLRVTIAVSAVGAILLALSQLLPGPKLPEGMCMEEWEALSPPMTRRESQGRGGGHWGRSFGGEASFISGKEAWRRGAWKYDRRCASASP